LTGRGANAQRSSVPSVRQVIAVVDDEEAIRKALSRLMGTAGYDVETFESGASFLACVERHAPDCLVLDLHMPGVSGFEVQERLARTAPGVPVVVITGHDIPEAGERVLAAGAAAYMRKPVDGDALLDVVAGAIAASREKADRAVQAGKGDET
jgi:FixJ family two-component response regulator